MTSFSDFPGSGLLAQKRVINFASVVDAMAAPNRHDRAFACLFSPFLVYPKSMYTTLVVVVNAALFLWISS